MKFPSLSRQHRAMINTIKYLYHTEWYSALWGETRANRIRTSMILLVQLDGTLRVNVVLSTSSPTRTSSPTSALPSSHFLPTSPTNHYPPLNLSLAQTTLSQLPTILSRSPLQQYFHGSPVNPTAMIESLDS
jgi:hypothetical protein